MAALGVILLSMAWGTLGYFIGVCMANSSQEARIEEIKERKDFQVGQNVECIMVREKGVVIDILDCEHLNVRLEDKNMMFHQSELIKV